jgi:hypothetical protein
MATSYHVLKAGSHAEGFGENYRRWSAGPKGSAPAVVESERDLSAEFPEKFEPYRGEVTPAMRAAARSPRPRKAPHYSAEGDRAPAYGIKEDAPEEAAGDLDGLTVAELRDVAAGEEVELTAHMKKDEIVEAIRKARGG